VYAHVLVFAPTAVFIQWPLNDSHPLVRLDFILVSHSIVYESSAEERVKSPFDSARRGGYIGGAILNISTPADVHSTNYSHSVAADASGGRRVFSVSGGVDISEVTEVLSDHFPVYASWSFKRGNGTPCTTDTIVGSEGEKFDLF
jgi:hypothetical protein